MNATSYAFDVTLDTFEQYVINNSMQVPVLVDFWAPWCGPCKTLMPLLEKLCDESAGAFLLAKVNIDENQELAGQFGVRSVPTVKLVHQGRVVNEFTGALPESQIRQFIEPHIERESDRQLTAIMEQFAQGQHEEALQQLRQLREAEPDNRKLLLSELEILLEMERLDETETLLQSLPANLQQETEFQALQSRLQLRRAVSGAPAVSELQQRLEHNPKDSEARYQLALQLSAAGDFDGALEAFMELLRRDRSYGDDAARRGMLQLFEQLGPGDERVARYRRQMFALLY